MQALNERFEMRLDQNTLRAIDAWRSGVPDVPSRGEAIRRLISAGLAATTTQPEDAPLVFTPVETLHTHILCEILKAVKPKSEADPDFIRAALYDGQAWAIRWESPGLVDAHASTQQTVRDVADTLQMWEAIEEAYEHLGAKDRDLVAEQADSFGKDPRFPGYDANNETEHFGVARFMIAEMGRFSRFAGRDLNSHWPSVETYRRMLAVFQRLRQKQAGRRLTAAELVELLNERTHPGESER